MDPDNLDTCEAFRFESLRTKTQTDKQMVGHKIVIIGHLVYVWGGYQDARDIDRLWILSLSHYTWTVHHLANKWLGRSRVSVMFLKDDHLFALISRLYKPGWTLVKIDALLKKELTVVQTHHRPDSISYIGGFLEERQEVVLINDTRFVDVLSLDSFTWHKAKTTGNVQMRVRFESCCSYRDSLYIAGSPFTSGNKLVIHILTAGSTSLRWSIPKVSAGCYVPSLRTGMTLTCSSPYRIIAFGGIGYFSEINVYDVLSRQWLMLTAKPKFRSDRECLGDRRGGTALHAAVQNKDFLLVIGGTGAQYSLSSPIKLLPRRD